MNNDQEGTPNQQTGRGSIKKTNMDLNKTPPAATNSNVTPKDCEPQTDTRENKNTTRTPVAKTSADEDSTENR